MAFTIKTMSSFLIICLNVLLHLVRGFEAFKATSNYEREVIVAGTDIPKGNFPYLAYIWYYNDKKVTKFCGGTLIDPNWILTSFGCVREAVSPAIAIHAVVGAHRKEEIDLCDHINVECHITSQENLFVNPNFNKFSWEYDFALLYLHNPSNFSTVKINTDTNVPVEKDKVTVAGWGSAKDSNNDNYYPDVSQEAELEVISRDACLQKYQNVPLTTNMQCVTGYGTSAFCRGDFGGPVIIKSNASSDILVGIMSWTGSSGCTKVPNVYGRVSSAAPWINSKITSIAPSKAPVSSKKLTPQLKRMPSSTPTTAANTDRNPTEQPTKHRTTAKPTPSEIPSLPPTKAQMLTERPTPKRTEAAVTPECTTSRPTKVNLTSSQGTLTSRSAHPTPQVTKTDLNVQKSTKLEFTVIFIVVGVVIGAIITAVFFGMSRRERQEEHFEIQKEDINRQDHQKTDNNTPPSTVELNGTDLISNFTSGFSVFSV